MEGASLLIRFSCRFNLGGGIVPWYFRSFSLERILCMSAIAGAVASNGRCGRAVGGSHGTLIRS